MLAASKACVFLSLALTFATSSWAQDVPTSTGITLHPRQPGYRKNWALLIGINYSGRQADLKSDPKNAQALPELRNAVNDAKALEKVLKTYYEYDNDGVVLLTDETDDDSKKPTAARIREELSKLCDSTKVWPDDSVVIFFAGHGFRHDPNSLFTGNPVALLPCDVKLIGGRPQGLDTFDLPDGLFEIVQKIPSQNKLVILDCCYSGEIFNSQRAIQFKPPTDFQNRMDKALQKESTFQAMVSCRAQQVAADANKNGGGNSRFTSALLEGLTHLPARSDGDRRVWSNRLLAYIRPNFDGSQRPDCRNLVNTDGEFCFYPKGPEVFTEFALTPDEKNHIRAMAVGNLGNWWFDEMPWFIPGLRKQLVEIHEKSQVAVRSNRFSDLIEYDALKASAKKLFRQQAEPSTELLGMRIQHAQELMTALDDRKLDAALKKIESELSLAKAPDAASATRKALNAVRARILLEPEDLHFLAVIQHKLGKNREAERTYERAIEAYQSASENAAETSRSSVRVLGALCRADYGEFLLKKAKDPHEGAAHFAEARREIKNLLTDEKQSEDSAAFFRIHLLCREADAWVALNRWSLAYELFNEAYDIAHSLAPNHYLQAYVYRQYAWARIYDWDMSEAKRSFELSNDILQQQFVREAAAHDEFVEERAKRLNGIPDLAGGFDTQLSSQFDKSLNHSSKIVYLHNLHGIAMAERFSGDAAVAARNYRWLSGEVDRAFTRFKSTTTDSELERQFIDRLINTQERLGDCNLFCAPQLRDLKEAADDYRRALSLVHHLRKWDSTDVVTKDSDRRRATLLYKQSLALSLPSPIQDTKLAMEMCERADRIFEKDEEKATSGWQALGKLTTRIVDVLDSTSQAESGSGKTGSVSSLRDAILSYRDIAGTTPQLDQLELCLFASKVLLEHGGVQDKYDALSDADLLLSFCRIGLSPYEGNAEELGYGALSESRVYLRPYYDAVMKAKLRFPVMHVRELLEIQSEATRGMAFMKSKELTPVIAGYVLDDDCYLFFDLPHGESSCVSLSQLYDISNIHSACSPGATRLPLPREIESGLIEWRARNRDEGKTLVELRWDNQTIANDQASLVGPQLGAMTRNVSKEITGEAVKQPASAFPFRLPNDFVPAFHGAENAIQSQATLQQ